MEVVDKKLQSYHGRINFIIKHHDLNRGHCAARNTGLKYASGDYILFVDSDDTLEPKALQYFHEELNKIENKEVDVIMGNAFDCMDKRCVMKFNNDTSFLIDNTNEEALRKLLSRELFHTSWNKLVKKTLFTKHNLYFEEGIINEDLLFSYLLFLHAKSVLIIPKVTYLYCKDNPDNITNTSKERISQIVRSRTLSSKIILDNPPNHPWPEYYAYVFYVLLRGIYLFENNIKKGELLDDLYNQRSRLLREVKIKRYYWLFLFFLTSVKPFFYLTKLRLYRRYFDRISRVLVSWTNH
jgi:glycosyltransferase involved in cell wall biosynthesis